MDDLTNLINDMYLACHFGVKMITCQKYFDINTDKCDALIALCNRQYCVIRCKSSICGEFDVIFSHISAIKLSQIKLVKYVVYEKLILRITQLCDILCDDVMRIIINMFVITELVEYYISIHPMVAKYDFSSNKKLMSQNHVDFVNYVKNNYYKLFY